MTSGVYARLRHPLHFGTTLQIFGLAVFVYLWQPLVAVGMLAISLAILFYRNRIEDLFLLKHLGAAYLIHYRRTWDIVDLCFWK